MKMLIDSQWVESSNGQWMNIQNPGTGEILDKVPRATLEDVEKSVAASQAGSIAMRKLKAFERYEILMRVAQSIEARLDEFGKLLAQENGKPVAQTTFEVGVAADLFRNFAEEGKRIFGRVIPTDAIRGQERHFGITIRQPLGVVAAIVPFNYPVELWAYKVAPALAAGNAVIAKPPSACPLTILKISKILEEAGLPRAAHQVVTGSGSVIGDFLARSSGIQMVTVTGSTEVGIKIARLAAENLKKIHMELGGNDAMIVLADCDLDKAADSVILGRLARGNGQICCAVKRIYIEESVYEKFVNLVTTKAKKLKVGDQLKEDTDVGPLINEEAAKEVEAVIEKAVKAGAKLRCGGKRNKAFIEPTVLEVSVDEPLFKEEVFGPVAPLMKFKTIEEAIRLVNDSPYGLQSAVFTNDINKAIEIGYKLEAGAVIVNWSSALRLENAPFGGIKMSGIGREGIHDALDEMTEQKAIIVHNAFPA